MPAQQRGSTQPRRSSPPNRGNLTGRQSDQLRKEQDAEAREAEARMSMATPIPVEEVDYTPEGVEESVRRAAVEEEQTEVLGNPQGTLRIEAGPRKRRTVAQQLGVGGGDPDTPITITVNGHYPEVTLGVDNTFDFEENRPYRVPRWVAAHLEEKGMLARIEG